MIRVEASAPSNIALIKYMGKTKTDSNLPSNASLSYTLENLRSFVVIEENSSGTDEWQPLAGFAPIALSNTGREKFMNHFAKLKSAWNIRGNFTLSSANNFPSDCGLASSASSFAALTKTTALLAQKQNPKLNLDLSELSRWSRQGSGSSCRSFFSPWAIWKSEGAEPVDLKLQLDHAVVLVEESVKTVSSSQAHLRVTTSRLFQGRTQRAHERLEQLQTALRENMWREAFELCWSEFWDMHALFETSAPAFGYMQPETLRVLNHLRAIWKTEEGPLVTMDAGANVHVLWRQDQRERAKVWLKGFKIISSVE